MHTEGIWTIERLPTGHIYISSDMQHESTFGTICDFYCLNGPTLGDRYTFPNAADNARMVVAARNSYFKHCGDKAVAAAESDLLGEALEALNKLVSWDDKYPKGTIHSAKGEAELDALFVEARTILAKADTGGNNNAL